MKDYIQQFYNEGLATTFYLKPIGLIKKKVKNKNILKVMTFFVKLLYTILVLVFAWYIFWNKYPL